MKETILSEKSRNEYGSSSEKTCLATVGFDCAGFGTSEVQAHLKFGELFTFKSSKVFYKSK